MWRGLAVAALVVVAACRRTGVVTPPPVAPPAARTLAGPPPLAPRAGAPACVQDQDCRLLPAVTCCGECPPAPPFEVGPAEELDARLIESEQRCGADTRPCLATPACDPVPPLCTAHAACLAGSCGVIADGCGWPTS